MATTLTRAPLTPKMYGIPYGLFACLLIAGLSGRAAIGLGTAALVPLVLARAGLEISDNRRAYRAYYALGKWHVGAWQPLPRVVGLTLKYHSRLGGARSTASSWGIWNNAPRRLEELVVMLSSGSANGIILRRFPLDDVNPAIDFAHDVAELFDVPVAMYLPPNQFQPLAPGAE